MDYKAVLTAAAQRGASMKILVDALIKTLEEAKSNPAPDAVEKALSIARDIELCTKITADG